MITLKLIHCYQHSLTILAKTRWNRLHQWPFCLWYMVDPLGSESLTHSFLLRKALDAELVSTHHIRCLCLDPVLSHHRSRLSGVFGGTIRLYLLSSSATAHGSRHASQEFVILLLLHHLANYVTALMFQQPSSVGFHKCAL